MRALESGKKKGCLNSYTSQDGNHKEKLLLVVCVVKSSPKRRGLLPEVNFQQDEIINHVRLL
jgi:hypothetical protein